MDADENEVAHDEQEEQFENESEMPTLAEQTENIESDLEDEENESDVEPPEYEPLDNQSALDADQEDAKGMDESHVDEEDENDEMESHEEEAEDPKLNTEEDKLDLSDPQGSEDLAPEDEGEHAEEEDIEGDDDEENAPPETIEANNNLEETAEATDSVSTRKRSASHSSTDEGPKRKQGRSGSINSRHDTYCWVCHKDGVQAFCKICPRSYHFKCMHLPDETPGKGNQVAEPTSKSCICPECAVVMNAENLETRSESMKQLTVDQLISMLKNACQRMKSLPGAEPFLYPVDPDEALDYFKYVVYPMDLCTLENNVKKRQYGSTEAFLADAQWLVHNSTVFNSASSQFTTTAKRILKTCKQEIQEIETCHECYVNAHTKPDSWFVDACKRPHILVWAKLKGFPYWPAKAMKIKDDMVDVRFFGQHDRAWVLRKDCYLYSEEMPGSGTTPKRNNHLIQSIEELNSHIEKLKEINGPFVFATTKTPIGPQLSVEQIRKMLPEYKPDESSAKVSAPTSVQQPPSKKSPMTIRISSLKTNPTIVNNSVVEESATSKPILRIRKSALTDKPTSESPEPTSEGGNTEQAKETEETEEQGSAEEEESTEPTPKPVGLLATALGARTTRRSRSDATLPNEQSEKRMTRSANKSSVTSESGDESKEKEKSVPPPDSFLQSIGLRKTSEVKSKPASGAPMSKHLPSSDVYIKGEPDDVPEDEYIETSGSSRHGVGVKAQELMNQISGSGKSGMRFNLSKDISISPVGDESHEREVDVRPRRPMMQGHRMPPGLIPQNMQMVGGRPRQMGNVNGGMNRNATQQNRLMQRPQRPGGQMRPMMKLNGPRPHNVQMTAQHMKNQGHKGKDSALIVESSSLRLDGQGYASNTVQLNQVQSIQGAITLPGGTITVTPLAPVIGLPITTSAYDGSINGAQVMTLKQGSGSTNVTTANGLPISVLTPHEGGQSILKSNLKAAPHQRRNLMNQVPASVGHLVQSLQKNIVESVRSTMEQIVVEMIEKAPNPSGGPEMKALKDETEKLKKQLVEHKHTHDMALREMKMLMENDKKRALNDQRRQFDAEKTKIIEETKKKQWCARCAREAQFYCCWNTSYCGYGCQEEHWPSHMNSCSQSTGGGSRQ